MERERDEDNCGRLAALKTKPLELRRAGHRCRALCRSLALHPAARLPRLLLPPLSQKTSGFLSCSTLGYFLITYTIHN